MNGSQTPAAGKDAALPSQRLPPGVSGTSRGVLVIVRPGLPGLGLEPNAADTGAIALNWKSAMWTPSTESYSWKPIESAPLDEDVTLQVTDGRGKPYTLRNPSRLTVAGWVSSGKGTPLSVKPVRWRPYHGSPPSR